MSEKKEPMWILRPYQEILKRLGPHRRQDFADAVQDMKLPNPNYKPNQGNEMNEIEGLTRIEQDMRLKEAAWTEFMGQLFADAGKKLPFTRAAVQDMRTITHVTPGFESQAACQARKIGSYLSTIKLPGTVLAFLICGVVPSEMAPSVAPSFRLFTGELVTPTHGQVRDAFWVLRRWHRAEENTGLVDWVDFFVWCQENDIDTNYLRYMRELTATGHKGLFGDLPLKELVKYGHQF